MSSVETLSEVDRLSLSRVAAVGGRCGRVAGKW